jgi:hypothetical protein
MGQLEEAPLRAMTPAATLEMLQMSTTQAAWFGDTSGSTRKLLTLTLLLLRLQQPQLQLLSGSSPRLR